MAVRKRERASFRTFKRCLCLSRTSLSFFLLSLLPLLCLFGRDTHARVSRGTFIFKRCNFDAIVCFAVSLDVEEKKRVLDCSFLFLLLFGFRFRDERRESNKELLLCC